MLGVCDGMEDDDGTRVEDLFNFESSVTEFGCLVGTKEIIVVSDGEGAPIGGITTRSTKAEGAKLGDSDDGACETDGNVVFSLPGRIVGDIEGI
mmetsp:Transcript_13200/g.20024  ORF Transcript_13200/g.20024 Transcript_13200/m.20024 type:complete len:94 (+) Transcript_13200:292-573(+)